MISIGQIPRGTETVGPDGTYWLHMDGHVICPDRLRGEMLGEADNLRGRVVRAFFRVLDRFMPVDDE